MSGCWPPRARNKRCDLLYGHCPLWFERIPSIICTEYHNLKRWNMDQRKRERSEPDTPFSDATKRLLGSTGEAVQ
ncbi:unnamed protein product [Fusarium graminearum]|nr:unnamed protein product [Fusarium graminearum]